MREKRYAIDEERTKEAFKRCGKTARQVCQEIGRGNNYFTQAYDKGFITQSTKVALEKIVQIQYEDIKPVKAKDDKECAETYVKELIPDTEAKRWFEVLATLSLIEKGLNQQAQQRDEIIDLLIRQNSLLADLLETWKPEMQKAC